MSEMIPRGEIVKCAFALTAGLWLLGCSGFDPSESSKSEATAIEHGALSGRRAGTKPEASVLVALGDGTIRRLSSTGKDLGVFARTDSPFARGMTLDHAGNIYVARAGQGIRKFSPSGLDLGPWSSGNPYDPFGVAVDLAGNLLVSEGTHNTVGKFSMSGHPLGTLVSLFGIGCPAGIAVNRAGTLVVADLCASVVRQLAPGGASLALTSGISHPIALTFDHAGNLFVANSDNGGAYGNTIREFAANGDDLGPFASEGLRFPGGLAFLPDGTLLVTNEEQRPETIDYSIRAFAPDGEDLGDFAVLTSQPQSLLVLPPHGFGR